MHARTGFTLTKASLSPPVIMASVPAMAMGLPPLTGESSRNIPASLACWYSSRMISGAVELKSTITLPGFPY